MEFDTPSPQTRTGHDYSKNPMKSAPRIDYKTGKLESASVKMFFDGKLEPEYQVQGFQTYDSATKTRVAVGPFTAYVVGVYSASYSDGAERGDTRYFSNLVNDTRSEIIQSCYWGVDKSYQFAIGNYKADIVPAFESLRRKSSFTKILVAYIAERKELCAIHLNATLEAGLVNAVAQARGIEEYKASLFGLCDLTSEVWVFQFAGAFEPVVFSPKEAKRVPATVAAQKSDTALYFQPIFKAGVLRLENPKYGERVQFINDFQQQMAEYIDSEQQHLRGIMNAIGHHSELEPAQAQEARIQALSTPSNTAQPTRGGFADPVSVPFPTQDTTNFEVGALPGDDNLDLPF